DPGHYGRLARRRGAHEHGKLAVRAQLDAREPAALTRQLALDAGTERRQRLGREAVLVARRREARPVAVDGAHAAVDDEPRIGRQERAHRVVLSGASAARLPP